MQGKIFKRLLGTGKKRALVVHNTLDGRGDEIIRINTLLQSLLDFNPEVEIRLYTRRAYLYNPSTVRIEFLPNLYKIREFKVSDNLGRFDICLYFKNHKPEYSESKLERIVKTEFKEYFENSPIYIECKGYVFTRIRVQDNEIKIPYETGRTACAGCTGAENVYDSNYLLCTELGLPIRTGVEKPRHKSLIIEENYPEARTWWRDYVEKRNTENRKVIAINGFGGQSASKGLATEKLAELIRAVVQEYYAVILLNDNKMWGSKEDVDRILKSIPQECHKHITCAPSPSKDSRLYKNIINNSDAAVSVEGLFVHFAYALGKPFIAFRTPSSGSFDTWLPKARDQSKQKELKGDICDYNILHELEKILLE